MSGDTRHLKVIVDGDGKGGQRALSGVNDGLERVDQAQQKASHGWENFRDGLVAATTVAGVGLLKLGKSSVSAASDLNETQSKIGVIFKGSSDAVNQWAANMAADFGQSKKSALDAAATFAIYGKAAKLTGKDLFNFSTDLTTLASDMASFSNTSPEEAIEAIGAAMRGESDPIEKYGVLLNESVLKQRAFKEGIIKTTKEALSPQQRVLAVQAELYAQLGKKGSGTLGDFERTSTGLANQQRILSAQWTNWKAQIGQSLLPVVQQFVTMLNSKVMPALNGLWVTHGPAVTAFLSSLTTKVGALFGTLGSINWGDLAGAGVDKLKGLGASLAAVDWTALGAQVKSGLGSFGPALAALKENGGTALSDGLNVGATALKFFADHLDLLGKALPYVLAGLVAYKAAVMAKNVADAAMPVVTGLAALANLRLAASNRALAASMAQSTASTSGSTVATGANTVATTTGASSRLAAVGSWLALAAAQARSIAVTAAQTVAQWAQNAAWLAFPVTWIVAAILVLIGIIIVLWKKNETFRRIVTVAWNAIKLAFAAVVDWVKTAIPAAWDFLIRITTGYFKFWYNVISTAITAVKNFFVGGFNFYKNLVLKVWNWLKTYTVAVFNFWRNVITSVISAVRSKVSAGVNAIKSAFSTGFTVAKNLVVGAMNLLKSGVTSRVNSVLGVVRSIKSKVTGFFSGAKNMLANVGHDIVTGLVNGLLRGLSKVTAAARRLASAIPQPIKDMLGIHSPSKVMEEEVGEPSGDGVVAGIENRIPAVHKAMRKLVPPSLADTSVSSAPYAAAGSVTVIQHITVQGHVTTEKKLAESIAPHVRDAVVRKGKNNGGRTGL
ncbi:hypothetical protein AB0M54_45985 [Actinoplanes sp. NPDC051470]|uniref:hypothetical protein n=1 Tax=Actinoplanes sp. NPDC051470 TaxID=3157224 RepID=UPI0034242662